MKISKAKLRQIIKEELAEVGETPRMSPSEAGAKWTEDEEIFKAAVYAAVDANLPMRAIRNMVEEVFQKIGNEPNWSGNKNPMREDADDDRDFEIEEAIRDGEADGASGEERTPPHSFASRYYNDAYDRAAKKSK